MIRKKKLGYWGGEGETEKFQATKTGFQLETSPRVRAKKKKRQILFRKKRGKEGKDWLRLVWPGKKKKKDREASIEGREGSASSAQTGRSRPEGLSFLVWPIVKRTETKKGRRKRGEKRTDQEVQVRYKREAPRKKKDPEA